MNVLIVYAHHEPSSFTAAMKNLVFENMKTQGHAIAQSDLYGQGFNPVAQKWDFTTLSGNHVNYMMEQKHAAINDWAFSPDLVGELQKVKQADLIFLVAPIWWFGVPAILKGWFDRVLAMGVAWDGGKTYENGLFRGKQAMVIASAGHPEPYYKESGKNKATITQILHPIHHGTLAFCGMNVHEPFVALNVLGLDQPGREAQLKELDFRLKNIVGSPNMLISYG